MKRFVLEATTLVIAAIICALTANALASRERKVALVPAPVLRAAPPPPAASQTTITTTTAAEGGGAPPITPKKPATVNRQPSTPPKAAPTFKPHPDKAYIEIHGDDVAALHRAGALFLDARRTSAYEEGHIAGARPFSVWEADVDQKVQKLYDERSNPADQEKPIVIYCSGGDCEDSHMLAQKLWGAQFNNVYVYKDGFPDWQKRRGAVHTGANP